MIESIIQPKAPNNPAWQSFLVDLRMGFPALGYHHERLGLTVISAVEVAEEEIGPEYHLTISRSRGNGPRRCSADEARMVLVQFGAEAAREDNHSPVLRSFWLPVNQTLAGIECECKATEAVIREGDFEWRPLTQAAAAMAAKEGE